MASKKHHVTIADVSVDEPQTYEEKHVHEVYDQIASHFSSTRYKPWPIIARFISDIPPGWIGVDSGTGNGKYLGLLENRLGSVRMLGLDRSKNLLEIARTEDKRNEVIQGDIVGRFWRTGVFDFAISIATIHHLATPQRRASAVQCLLEAVSKSHGRILIYVWAVEQDELSKRVIPKSTSPDSTGQDVFVPWVLPSNNGQIAPAQVIRRYYHLFGQGELMDLIRTAAGEMNLYVGKEIDGVEYGLEVVQDGWERSNYYVELRRWAKNCNREYH